MPGCVSGAVFRGLHFRWAGGTPATVGLPSGLPPLPDLIHQASPLCHSVLALLTIQSWPQRDQHSPLLGLSLLSLQMTAPWPSSNCCFIPDLG